jgi:hypothetical protein
MATNLALDPDLVDRAVKVSGEKDQEGGGYARAGGIHRPPQPEAAGRFNGKTRMG